MKQNNSNKKIVTIEYDSELNEIYVSVDNICGHRVRPFEIEIIEKLFTDMGYEVQEKLGNLFQNLNNSKKYLSASSNRNLITNYPSNHYDYHDYVIPMVRTVDGYIEEISVITPAINSYQAMLITVGTFSKDGWTINRNFEEYKIL